MAHRIACLAASLGLLAAATPAAASARRATEPSITVPVTILRHAMDCRGQLSARTATRCC